MMLLAKILVVCSIVCVILAVLDYIRVSRNIRRKEMERRKERYKKW